MLSTFLSLSFAGVQLYSTRVFSIRPSMWTSSTMKSFSGASLRVLQSYVDGNSRRGRYHGEREEGWWVVMCFEWQSDSLTRTDRMGRI